MQSLPNIHLSMEFLIIRISVDVYDEIIQGSSKLLLELSLVLSVKKLQ